MPTFTFSFWWQRALKKSWELYQKQVHFCTIQKILWKFTQFKTKQGNSGVQNKRNQQTHFRGVAVLTVNCFNWRTDRKYQAAQRNLFPNGRFSFNKRFRWWPNSFHPWSNQTGSLACPRTCASKTVPFTSEHGGGEGLKWLSHYQNIKTGQNMCSKHIRCSQRRFKETTERIQSDQFGAPTLTRSLKLKSLNPKRQRTPAAAVSFDGSEGKWCDRMQIVLARSHDFWLWMQ